MERKQVKLPGTFSEEKNCLSCGYMRTAITGSDLGIAFCPYCKLRGKDVSFLSAVQYEYGDYPKEGVCEHWRKASLIRKLKTFLTAQQKLDYME